MDMQRVGSMHAHERSRATAYLINERVMIRHSIDTLHVTAQLVIVAATMK